RNEEGSCVKLWRLDKRPRCADQSAESGTETRTGRYGKARCRAIDIVGRNARSWTYGPCSHSTGRDQRIAWRIVWFAYHFQYSRAKGLHLFAQKRDFAPLS